MQGIRRMLGRALGLTGMVLAVPYLVWRVVASLDGTAAWLSVPALVVEAAGLASAALLTWALWPSPGTSTVDVPGQPGGSVADVVVGVDRQADHELRATLLALRSVRSLGQVVVADRTGRPSVAALAARHGAQLVAANDDDPTGLAAALDVVRTPRFLVLDAGDVPSADVVATLSPYLGARVAVVQGRGASFAVDSAEHGHEHLHESAFEWSGLNPALGRRGAAMWTGSGSIVRTEAVRSMSFAHESAPMTYAVLGAMLQTSDWEIVAPATEAVVAHRSVRDHVSVDRDRTDRIRAAAAVVFGRVGALRSSGVPLRRRAALLAWAMRPLSPFRRAAFLLVVVASLLAGELPLQASGRTLLLLWLPTYLSFTCALTLLSQRTLRVGDRVRWSLQAIGSAAVAARSTRRVLDRPAAGPNVVILVLTVALVLRALSDRMTGTLPHLDAEPLTLLVLTVLWLLALTLEVMRILARRSTERRVARCTASLSAVLGDRSVELVDLTALGAGVLHHRPVGAGTAVTLTTTIPTATGVLTATLPCTVRNASRTRDGQWRLGLEFASVDEATADALAEFCTVEPMRDRMGTRTPVRTVGQQVFVDERPEVAVDHGHRGVLVRALALVALVGAAATSGTVEATEDPLQTLEGTVLLDTDLPPEDTVATDIGVSGVLVVAVCSLGPGEDGTWGSTDDLFSEPILTETDAFGGYRLEVTGEACWAMADPVLGEIDETDLVPLAMVADATGGDVLTVELPPVVEADPGVAVVAVQSVVDVVRAAALIDGGTVDAGDVAAPPTAVESAAGPARALPTPAPELLPQPSSPLLARLVLLVTSLLAVGVVATAGRRQSVSPKF